MASAREAASGRSTLWLVSGIATGALAAAALGVGVGMYVRTGEVIDQSDEWHQAEDTALAMYITAGVLASASVAAFVLYGLSGHSSSGERAARPAGVPAGLYAGVGPANGGVVVGAGCAF